MENDVNKIIGKNLLTLRKLNKLTQLELAEKLSYSDKSISKWEKGESLPSIEILYELAKFYHVTLDALTTDGADFSSPTQQVKSRREKFFPTRLCVTLLAVVAIWLIATVMFVSFKLALDKNFFMCFIWAIPASAVLLIIFNSIWGKPKWLFVILTVLIWSFITALYLQLITYNIWPIYFLGIPLQAAVVFALALTKPKNKKPKEKVAKVKKQKHKKDKQTRDEQEEDFILTKRENDMQSNVQSDDDKADEINNLAADEQPTFDKPVSEGKIEVSLPQISRMPNNNKK